MTEHEDNFSGSSCNSDGSCSGCGKCCSDLLPLSDMEINRIRHYVKEHGIKAQKGYEFGCPFRDDMKKKCTIYSIRPEICRSFICSKPLGDAKEDKRLFEEVRTPKSVFFEIFKDSRNLETLRSVTALLAPVFDIMGR